MPPDDDDDELGVKLDWPNADIEPAPMSMSSSPPEIDEPVVDLLERDDSSEDDIEVHGDDIDDIDDHIEVQSDDHSIEVDGAYSADEPHGFPPQTPLLPAVSRKLEDLRDNIATLAMRIDALGSTTTSFQSSFSDRLTEYMDTIARITRSQQDMLEEYRHGNDRAVAELRREVGSSEDLLRRISGRVDEVVTGMESVDDIARLVAELKATSRPAPAVDRSSINKILAEVEALRGEVVAGLDREPVDDIAGLVAELKSLSRSAPALDASAINEILAEVEALRGEVAAGLDKVADVAATVADSSATAHPAASTSDDHELITEIAGLREEVVQLKRRISVRAKAVSVLDDEQVEALLDRLVERIGRNGLAGDDIDRLAAAIVARLEQTLEVVPEDPAAPAPAPAPAPRPKATKAPTKASKASKAPAKASSSPRRRSN